jgi:hypothetical protein
MKIVVIKIPKGQIKQHQKGTVKIQPEGGQS